MTRSGATARHIEVAVSGDLEVWSAPQVSQVIQHALALSPTRLVIDLAACSGIDASGIQLLLDIHREAILAGGALTLTDPCERVMRNLRLSKVDRVLHIVVNAPHRTRPARSASDQGHP